LFQFLHQSISLLSAQPKSGRIALPGKAQVVAMEGDVDVLGEPADQPKHLRE